MSITKIVLSFWFVVVAAGLSHGKEWRGIVPLHSTRADVEKLLGPSKEAQKQHVSTHETENEVVLVEYSTGAPCGSGWPRVWRVPRDTVINVVVHPKRDLWSADLHLDERNFKKTDNQGHGPPYFYYTNEKDGVQYEVTQGRVMTITYFHAAEDEHLRCPSQKHDMPKAKGWRGIVPLVSSRLDVERILGPPQSRGKFVSSYNYESESVDVYYASGPPCGSGLTNAWRVPRDRVVSIRVVPKKTLILESLVNDIAKFRRTADSKVPSQVYFLNEEEGVRYTVRIDPHPERQDVISVDYIPEKRQNHLKCPSVPSIETPLGDAPFERYGRVSASTQRAILDNFAIQLKNESQLKGLVVVNAGSNERRKAVRQIRRHLIHIRGIEPQRLVVRNGALRREFSVELYLIPITKNLPN